jgi:hypothetical protein
MKPKLILCLALVLSGELFGCSTLKSGNSWGNTVDGFQMTAILDKNNGLVHCQIRNATDAEMDYPSFDFGYVEYVHLQIEELTNWVNLPATKLPLQGAVGGYYYFTKKIKPRQIAKVNDLGSLKSPVHTFADYLKWSKGNTNEALLTERINKSMADRLTMCANDTFTFDLVETDWRTNIFQYTPLKVRAVQHFQLRQFGPDQIIYSQEFVLDNSLIRSYINQRNKIEGK